MMEAIAEEAEMPAIEQSFLTMLEREHRCTAVQQRSLSRGQSAEQVCFVSAQLYVSSTTDNQETGMPFTRYVQFDACFVQLASTAIVASAFGGLMYKMLISRPELAAAVIAFAVSLVSCSETDTSIVHQGGLQVLSRHLQEVYSNLSGCVWTYTKEELLESSTILL